MEHDPHTGQYGLGLELVTLASRALNGNELYRVALGDLAGAAQEFDMTVNLSIMRDDRLFYLAVVEPPAIMTPISLIGERGELHSTAMGAVLLAGLPPDEREHVMARLRYPRFTPNTVNGPDELREKVALVAERGYAIDREEGALGRACVAAGIRGASGVVMAACSINAPMSVMDLDRRAPQLAARIVEIAEQISRKLGYRMGSGAVRSAFERPDQLVVGPDGAGGAGVPGAR